MAPRPARGRAIKPLNELTATEIAAAIGGGRTTSEAVVRACLDRIESREPEVRAWAHLDPKAALAAARTFDSGALA
jgi:Asp-tRNA(Asn)/Glu-tRNA(Gln) amidotransferase A subunit family amidase